MTLALASFPMAQSNPSPAKPRALRSGDTVGLVAPSAPLNPEHIERMEARLAERGLKLKVWPHVYERYGYLAGSDEARAKAVMEAFTDPEVDAVFPGTGGYGTTRMLDLLDYDAIRQHPKIIVGFSDTTGLHIAINKLSGITTFHSPSPMYTLGGKEPNEFALRHFWRAVMAEEYTEGESGYTIQADADTTPTWILNPGKAQGRLVGGNLSLLAALSGTPYDFDTAGKILFIEDVREAPYRVDRMLSTLRLSGKLDNCAGVVIGFFHRCEPEEPEKSLTVEDVFRDYFAHRSYPVIANFPVGHVGPNATLPIGTMAELDADAMTLRLLENPVELGSDASAER